MNKIFFHPRQVLQLVTMASVAIVLAACAAPVVKNPDSIRVRNDLAAIQTDPKLASLAPVALKDAESAVTAAEIPTTDPAMSSHLVYIADRKVKTAKELAQAQYAADQRKVLSDQGDKVRLESRTREADMAKSKNEDLMAQLADLKAKKTDRGVEINLGDVLFSSGRADLKPGAVVNLDKLVAALNGSPTRQVAIEGFTDNQGADDMNLALSQKRADAVSMYLSGHGIDASRVSSVGKGEAFPVADNTSASGRQLNRRVVVTIKNPT